MFWSFKVYQLTNKGTSPTKPRKNLACQGRHASVASSRHLVLDELGMSILSGTGSSWRLKDVLHTRIVPVAVLKALVQQLQAA
jgi:hypothetical protein